MKKLYPKLIKRERGQSLVETALALPFIFIILFGITQLSLYLYTQNIVHYAAFMAARSAVVYGDKKLSDIGYPRGDTTKRIAEATAEKIIIESLPWERSRITLGSDSQSRVDRTYSDLSGESGAIQVSPIVTRDSRKAIEVVYCLPVHFGLVSYFVPKDYMGKCAKVAKPKGAGFYTGIEVRQRVMLLDNL